MNRLRTAIVAVIATATLAVPAAAAVNARQLNQYRLIDAGARSGLLTRAEVRTLRAEQRAINRNSERFEADGRYTNRERAIIRDQQEAARRHIDRLKNNGRRR